MVYYLLFHFKSRLLSIRTFCVLIYDRYLFLSYYLLHTIVKLIIANINNTFPIKVYLLTCFLPLNDGSWKISNGINFLYSCFSLYVFIQYFNITGNVPLYEIKRHIPLILFLIIFISFQFCFSIRSCLFVYTLVITHYTWYKCNLSYKITTLHRISIV